MKHKKGSSKGKHPSGKKGKSHDAHPGGQPGVQASQPASSSGAAPGSAATAAGGGVVGLSNLGNTCFFNSAVQMLMACPALQQAFLAEDRKTAQGPLGYALQQAFRHAAKGGPKPGGGSASYNPQSLLSAVCRHAPQFKGRQQHDSHELLRVLLDGLQTEEKRSHDLARRGGGSGGGFTAADAEEDEDEDEYARESWDGSLTGSPKKRPVARSDDGSGSSSSSSSSSDSSDEDGGEAGGGAQLGAAAVAEAKAAAAAAPAKAPTPPPVATANGNCAHAHAAPGPDAAAAPLGRRSLLPPAPPAGPGDTLVDAVFGGVLVSTVVCGACEHSSVSYEPFLDLSLPIPAAQGGGLSRKDSLLSRLAGLGKSSKPKGGDGDGEGAGLASPGKGEGDGEAEGGAKKKSSPKERKRAAAEAKRATKLERKATKAAAQRAAAAASAPAAAGNGVEEDGLSVERDGASSSVGSAPTEGPAAVAPSDASETSSATTAEASPVAARANGGAATDGGAPPGAAAAAAATSNGGAPPPAPRAASAGGAGPSPLGRSLTPPPTPAPPKPHHRRFGSLGSLSNLGTISANAKGQLSALLSWGSRQGSRELEGALSALAGSNVSALLAAAAGEGQAPAEGGAAPAVATPTRAEAPAAATPAAAAAGAGAARAAPMQSAFATAAPPFPVLEAAAAGQEVLPLRSWPLLSQEYHSTDSPLSPTAAGPVAEAAAAGANGSAAAPQPAFDANGGPSPGKPAGGGRAANAAAAEAAAAAAAVGARRGRVTAMSCLEAFFVRELVSWECPKEKAEARERRWSTASGGGGTPSGASLGRQVTFSDRLPSVVSVPGSVEQRGTDLERALSGAAPFCRPVGHAGAALLLTAQLSRFGAEGASASPAAMLVVGSAGAPGGAPASGGALRLKLVAAGEPTRKTNSLVGPAGIDLGLLPLPPAAAAAAGRGRLLRAWAQLALDCMADLMRHEGGIKGLCAMLAGGARLAAPPDGAAGRRRAAAAAADDGASSSSSGEGGGDEYLGWLIRGHLPRAAGRDAGYWEYPNRDGADDGSDADGEGDGGGAAAAGAAGGGAARCEGGGGGAGDDDAELFGMEDLGAGPEQQQAKAGKAQAKGQQQNQQQQQQQQPENHQQQQQQAGAGSGGSGDQQQAQLQHFRKIPSRDGLANGHHAHAAPPAPASDPGRGSPAAGGSAPVDIARTLHAAGGAAGTPLSGTPRRSSLSARTFTRDAAKSYQVYLPPRVLVLHLKRFAHDMAKGGKLQKLDAPVQFEFELDLAPFLAPSSPAAGRPLPYDLAGVVVHMGNMRSGHYVAYVKRGAQQGAGGAGTSGGDAAAAGGPPSPGPVAAASGGGAAGLLSAIGGALGGGGGKGGGGGGKEQWYYVSDGTVRQVSRSEVASAQAYMLLYTARSPPAPAAPCACAGGAAAGGPVGSSGSEATAA
ncbi:ubiquitin carboxyl-terminal hydrolase [Raphidocelis subcapitata]|uniref:ubiquitinyl hydrolase 1 n=1 Tax=Raphidocelis subcapitata TaxID=307507 RepID=A0A2V0NQ92_9CHLO|nr:ubiquitin carboxyl-terminal hydrolase [Raphidocelis subcapitata]|eukprot:GBF89794.1 ubiquitin carboxyl-terminal hydrolase [Raphidocelis subcapitata]